MDRPPSRPLHLAERATVARFTADEFVRMAKLGAFDDMKVKLIGGELTRMNPPMGEHANGQARLVIRIASAVAEKRVLGERASSSARARSWPAILRIPVTERRMLNG